MNYQVLCLVFLVLLVALAIYTHHVYRERDKYLFNYKPVCRERDNLKEELGKMKALSQEGGSVGKKDDDGAQKAQKDKGCESDAPAEVAQLRDKIKSLKADNAKLKEENYNIRKDNKSLRQDIKERAQSNDFGQREIVDLRALNEDLEAELKIAKDQVKALEQRAADISAGETPAEKIEASAEDKETIAVLQKENASLQAMLKDVRGELTSYKRDFKARLDEAKKALYEANKPIKKEMARAEKLSEQAKKRASNNHKIYLIARAQLILAEKKLAGLDPSYKPTLPLPVSNDAIAETVKKIDTMGARASKASSDAQDMQKTVSSLRARVDALREDNEKLEAENRALKAIEAENKARLAQAAQKDEASERKISFGALDDDPSISDDSLNALISDVAVKHGDDKDSASAGDAHEDVKVSESKSLIDLDFGDMDDDWA